MKFRLAHLNSKNHVISLEVILFVILVLRYLLSVAEKSPNPLFFSLVILCIVTYVLLDTNPFGIGQKSFLKIKTVVFLTITFLLIYLPLGYLIINRHVSNNQQLTVDSTIQSEQAIKYLLKGTNPYSADYEPALKDWPPYASGALSTEAYHHFAYLPFFLLINIPGYLLIENLFGFFDLRLMSSVMLTLTIFLIFKFTKTASNKILFATLVVYNPILLTSYLWGLNDIYIVFFVLCSMFALRAKKLTTALILLAFAVAMKQSAWPLVPFVLAYITFKQRGRFKDKFILSIKRFSPFFITVSIILLPFVLWNARAFWQDIWLYPNGGLLTSAPMGDFGLSELLIFFNIVGSRSQNFPFWIFQIITVVTLLPFLIYLQSKRNSLSQVMINYAILLLPLLYTSRILHYNYLAYFSVILTAAYFMAQDELASKK